MDVEEIIASIPQKIIEARIKRRLNQKDLAELLGVSQSSISAWERGEKQIGGDTLVRAIYKLDILEDVFPDLVAKIKQSSPQELTVTEEEARKTREEVKELRRMMRIIADLIIQKHRLEGTLDKIPKVLREMLSIEEQEGDEKVGQ